MPPLTILFVMPRLSFLRFFQAPLDLMLDRGHRVVLAVESPRTDEVEGAWLERALAQPNFRYERLDHLKRYRLGAARTALRIGMEYVRRMGPEYENRVAGRPRTRLSRAPALVRAATRLPLVRSSAGLRALRALLASIDRLLPRPRSIDRYLDTVAPDVVAVCDKGHPGSLTSLYIDAALARGVSSALCVASWDNLTNRQRIPTRPDLLLVWNEWQRREALDFHGIPSERVAITGAPRFDDWFGWPAHDRAAFLERVGLDPEQPVLLWVAGALNEAPITEADFVTRWLRALRESGDAALERVGVLVRPHPERLAEWREADYSAFENVVVWPRGEMTFPIEAEAKAAFFNSIHHAHAVVGINSSAMIEASIVGRPVLTVLVPEFHDSQRATFHFEYLVAAHGGPVQVAASMAEHLADLRAALDRPAADVPEQTRRFVAEFVRPCGVEQPATEVFVDTLERLAERGAPR